MNERRRQKEQRRREAQQARLTAFEGRCAALRAQGRTQADCTFGALAANVFGMLAALPFAGAAVAAYFLCAPAFRALFSVFAWDFFALAGMLLVSLPVHEGLHGLFWAAANRSFRGIRFGVMREFLTPYCACEAPMHSAAYVCGTLAPFVFLGLGLSAAGIAAGYWALLCAGVFNIFCAGADILVSARALGGGVLLDHPERCGFYRFRKGD